ncbi:MAG: family metalloprotease protein, partial [Nocardioides sp.]|nr:family metalloprotease protein [Nocardioides sp.]
PQPGSATPDLNDAAFTAATDRKSFSDASASPHVDNYSDPSSASANWEFAYSCLGFDVLSMTGNADGPPTSDGDLTGNVKFTMGTGCGTFDYGYTPTTGTPNTDPTAKAKATPTSAGIGETVAFSGTGSDDAETPDDLDYTWDFDNGGAAKDASGENVSHAFHNEGTYDVKLTVTDPQGGSATDTVTVIVAGEAPGNQAPTAKAEIKPRSPYTQQRVKLSGAGSSDAETSSGALVYQWNFGDGGARVDAVGQVVRTRFTRAGYRTVSLTVIDAGGKRSTVDNRVLVQREVACGARRVSVDGSWRRVQDDRARGGSYCDNAGTGSGRDSLALKFQGRQIDVWFGRAANGGVAKIVIDGKTVGAISFKGSSTGPKLTAHRSFTGLDKGRHRIKLVVTSGRAYVEGFGITR